MSEAPALAALRRTARASGTWLGFFGAVITAVAMFAPSLMPPHLPLRELPVPAALDPWLPAPLAAALILAGLICLLVAWWLLRPPDFDAAGEASSLSRAAVRASMGPAGQGVSAWMVVVLWSLPFLLAPPAYSTDAYLYADLGWIQHRGFSPYEVGMAMAGGPSVEWVAPAWRGATSPYAPLSLVTHHLMAFLAGFDPYWGAIANRIPAIAGTALLVIFVPRLAVRLGADPVRASWLGVINPMVVVHCVGGAHNDAMMIGVLILALWVAAGPPRHLWLAAALVGVATAFKQPAVFGGLAVALLAVRPRTPGERSWRPLVRRVAGALGLSALVGGGVFIAITWATGLGWGWTGALSLPGSNASWAPRFLITEAGSWAAQMLGDHRWPVATVVSLVSAAVFLALFVVAIKRYLPAQPVAFLGWTLAAFVLTGVMIHGWYLVWPVAVLAASGAGRRAARGIFALSLFSLVYLAIAEYVWVGLVGAAPPIG